MDVGFRKADFEIVKITKRCHLVVFAVFPIEVKIAVN
jgi:hypothetical protein